MHGLMEKTHPSYLAVFCFSPLFFFCFSSLFFLLILFFKIMSTEMVRVAKITATPYLVPIPALESCACWKDVS